VGGGICRNGCPQSPVRSPQSTESCILNLLIGDGMAASTAVRAYKIFEAADFIIDFIPVIDLIDLAVNVFVTLAMLEWAYYVCTSNPQ
jgi:hypothetical protein